jgi:hypothetical protein
MKTVFIAVFCWFAWNIQAQEQKFIIKVENLNGTIRYDTFDFKNVGKTYIGCIIRDQYETVKRLPIDTFPDVEGRVLSYEFTPPQYDSTIQTIEVRPAYSFYEVSPKMKLPKGASLIPPTWEIEQTKKFPVGSQLGVKRVKGLRDYYADEECLWFVFEELPSFVHIYKRVLKTPALLIQNIDNKIFTDTLKTPSDYLKEVKIPARYIQVRTYRAISPATIRTISSLPNVVYESKKRRLVREGQFSEIRQFLLGCSMGHDSIVASIQWSLKKEGYRVKINDRMDTRTKNALTDYQKKHNLPSGSLNIETLKALGADEYTTFGERRIIDDGVECGLKNTKISDESLVDELIMLQALPDSEIADRAHCGLKIVKMRRKVLKINEVKHQTISFIK